MIYFKITRNGFWNNYSGGCRSASRFRVIPGIRYGSVGFRIVCPIKPKPKIIRGGSCLSISRDYHISRFCRSAFRYRLHPKIREEKVVGFRIVCETKPNPKLIRGGDWDYGAGGCRSACRGRFAPAPHMYFLGFRIVCEVNND